jgi:PAS domain S-box-containing protein
MVRRMRRRCIGNVTTTEPNATQELPAPKMDNAALYRLLVESVRDYAIFALDATGHIVTWNSGAQRFKGYTAPEIVGTHFSVFYPADDLARGKPAMELEVATREGRFEDEGWRVRKDGTQFWANVIITALRDERGRLVGFAKVTRDLTERRLSQQRAIDDARRLGEAEASSRAKTQFLASMSHELRTPLNAIGGYAELIEMGLGGSVSAQQREYLNRIRASQQHLLRIINDLLNYGQIEAGKLTYERKRVNLREVIDAIVTMMAVQASAKRVALTRGDCPNTVVALGDRLKIEQIVLNLVSNAVKFTPEAGAVTLDCMMQGDMTAVTVRDTGPGIPADSREQIFEPFVQLGRSLSSGHEGAGLGLAISRDLARAMGGELTVSSAHGEGAVFTVALPKATGTVA